MQKHHDIRQNYPRLKVLSLESVKGSWRHQWLQERLNAMNEELVMLRLFDVKWDRKHPLALPKYLELFRCSVKDPDFVSANPNHNQSETRGLSQSEIAEYNEKTKDCVDCIDFSNCIKLVEVQ
ncbi:hypothetical protein RFI_18240 [Reticulomyxa filosa]|uniref:Uncharacterized protein n=1 Tax=Reticulomyxa filosa TaxID=46433 RepID=X6MZD0_RETFI|nr:hypothetical protein RFI_18240 [Reticulomyxa filosa]|eukprot:ETO19003.1 hypothetical protein RFI_18240 [Reticulomyxa filosa]